MQQGLTQLAENIKRHVRLGVNLGVLDPLSSAARTCKEKGFGLPETFLHGCTSSFWEDKPLDGLRNPKGTRLLFGAL